MILAEARENVVGIKHLLLLSWRLWSHELIKSFLLLFTDWRGFSDGFIVQLCLLAHLLLVLYRQSNQIHWIWLLLILGNLLLFFLLPYLLLLLQLPQFLLLLLLLLQGIMLASKVSCLRLHGNLLFLELVSLLSKLFGDLLCLVGLRVLLFGL